MFAAVRSGIGDDEEDLVALLSVEGVSDLLCK
jgi:hypothetical protein